MLAEALIGAFRKSLRNSNHIKWVGSDEITWEERSNLLLTEAMQVAINEYDDYHT